MKLETLSLKTIINELDLQGETVIIQCSSKEKISTIVFNQIEKKNPDASNDKEYYNSYLKRKNMKSVKR